MRSSNGSQKKSPTAANPLCIIIVGPTASGKSDLAIALARKFNGEIISADSRQVYRGMDIGTGKVTKREQRTARHWLLDVASPTRQYSVARFKREAQKVIRDIARRGKVPIICGGTGFYIDALFSRIQFPNIPPNKKLRTELEQQSLEQLFVKLKKLDPSRAANIDRHNKRRLVRALEIIAATGRPVPAQVHLPAGKAGSEKFKVKSGWDILYLGISIPKEKLAKRITRRLDTRLKQGMIPEVKRLRKNGLSWKRLETFGLEYKWVALYLQNKITRQEMHDGLLRNIIAYAKRQMTWFKRNREIHWTTTPRQALSLAKAFLS